MQLQHVNTDFLVSDAVTKYLARLQQFWDHAAQASDGMGPWLFSS
jgi:hypothetical protein